MKVSLAGAWKETETSTEFGAIVPGMYLLFIFGRIKHIVKHHRCRFLYPKNKRTKNIT